MSVQLHQMAVCKCCTRNRIIQVVQHCESLKMEIRRYALDIAGKAPLFDVYATHPWPSLKLFDKFPNQLLFVRALAGAACCSGGSHLDIIVALLAGFLLTRCKDHRETSSLLFL